MKYLLTCICFVIALNGCVFISEPPDNLPFDQVSSLKELTGHYQNVGTGGNPRNPILLSKIIWTYDQSINHNYISTIAVRVTAENTLEIQALDTSNEVLKTDHFKPGKHFKFIDGKLSLKSGWHAFLGPDDPILGPKYEWIELGLDTKGDGKYSSGGGVIGLAFIFFPVIAVGEDEVRFVRIK